MKKPDLRFVFPAIIFSLCAFLSVALAQNSAALSVDVKSDKTSYAINEPIFLTYELRNNSSRWYSANIESFANPPSLLIVKGPTGENLISMYRPPCRVKLLEGLPMPLRPNGFHRMRLNLLEQFPESHPLGNPHNFDTPGIYEITGVYENLEAGDENLYWTGSISSQTTKIEIQHPSPIQIEQLQRTLIKGNNGDKKNAVEVIRKAKLQDLLEEVALLFNSDVSIGVKREAARTLYDLPDVKFYDIYIKNLKSKDSLTNAYAVLALGEKLKLKKAVPVLMEAINPQRAPEFNRPISRALIQIGDPRAISALLIVAENDPSEEVREYVNDEIKKLEAQKPQ